MRSQPMMKNDICIPDMVKILSRMEPMPPVTKALDKWGTVARDQKEHIIGWLCDQHTSGSGAYTRQMGNGSTRTAYNRFLNPGGLLWLAEVLGEKEGRLREAVARAIEAEKVNYRSRCAAFRQIIPFDRIMELLNRPEEWRVEKSVTTILPQFRFLSIFRNLQKWLG